MENFQGWTETFGTWVSFDLWLENQTRSPVTEVAIESGLLSTLAALDRGVELPLHFVFDDRSGYDPFTPTGPSETHTYRFTAVTENHPDVCRSGVVTPVQVDLEIVTDVESLGLVAMPVRPSCVWTE